MDLWEVCLFSHVYHNTHHSPTQRVLLISNIAVRLYFFFNSLLQIRNLVLQRNTTKRLDWALQQVNRVPTVANSRFRISILDLGFQSQISTCCSIYASFLSRVTTIFCVEEMPPYPYYNSNVNFSVARVPVKNFFQWMRMNTICLRTSVVCEVVWNATIHVARIHLSQLRLPWCN